MLDHDTFDVLGRWEIERGDQYLHYDFWWHLGYDTMVTSEWGTPNMVETGVQPDLLLDGQYGHRLHFWDLRRRRHVQTLDLGKEHQIVLELRPAHDPTRAYGFVNTVISLERSLLGDLPLAPSKTAAWAAQKVIEIPAEPADEDAAAAGSQTVQGRAAAGERHRAERRRPRSSTSPAGAPASSSSTTSPTRSIRSRPARSGSAASCAAMGTRRRAGRSTAGRRWSRSAATAGASTSPTRSTCPGTPSSTRTASRAGWSSSTPTPPAACSFDPNFFLDFGDQRPHQVRLQGGDASTDSYCFP